MAKENDKLTRGQTVLLYAVILLLIALSGCCVYWTALL